MTAERAAASSPRRALPPGIVPVSIAVAGFFLANGIYAAFESPGGGLRFVRPAYALFRPRFSPWIVLALVAGALLAGLATRAADRRRVLPFALAGMLAFAAAVVLVDGDAGGFTEPIERRTIPDVYADAGLVDRYGVRGVSERWEEAVGDATSIHTVSHPPGALLLIDAMRALDGTAALVALQGLLSILILLPAWAIARRVAGGRAAVVAVLLLAVAPAPVLHAFLSMDAVYATLMVGAIALLIAGLGPSGATRTAVLAGAAVGVVALFTYAAAFLAAFGILYALATRRRGAPTPLVAAALGGVAVLVLLRVALGYDVFSAYAASRARLEAFPTGREYLYGIVAAPMAWLAFAGLPMAGLAAHELWRRRPPYLVSMLVPLAAFFVLPWSVTGIIPLETERTVQFAYPLAAAAAGAAFVRWERARGAPSPRALVTLVGLTAAQTVLMEALLFFFW